jgi:hypothetical protein
MVIFTTILITVGIVLIWNNLQKTSPDLSNQHDVIKSQTNTITAVGEQEKTKQRLKKFAEEKGASEKFITTW